MHSIFLQPEQLWIAEPLPSMSNHSTTRGNSPELIVTSDLSVESGHVLCVPCLRPSLICVLQAYWWPICLRHGSFPTP